MSHQILGIWCCLRFLLASLGLKLLNRQVPRLKSVKYVRRIKAFFLEKLITAPSSCTITQVCVCACPHVPDWVISGLTDTYHSRLPLHQSWEGGLLSELGILTKAHFEMWGLFLLSIWLDEYGEARTKQAGAPPGPSLPRAAQSGSASPSHCGFRGKYALHMQIQAPSFT